MYMMYCVSYLEPPTLKALTLKPKANPNNPTGDSARHSLFWENQDKEQRP